jgi:hypothetical protein
MDQHKTAPGISSVLKENGILVNAIAPDKLRAVLHIGVSDSDLDLVQETLTRLFN